MAKGGGTGWTVDTLHSHMMQILDGHIRTREAEVSGLKELLESRISDFKVFIASQKEAEGDALKRSQEVESYNRDQVNEWGAALRNLSGTFATIAIVDRLEADQKRVELGLKDAVSKRDLDKIYGDIERLRDRAAAEGGKSQLISQLITNAISAIAILATLGVAIFESSRASQPAPPPVAIVQPITPPTPVTK